MEGIALLRRHQRQAGGLGHLKYGSLLLRQPAVRCLDRFAQRPGHIYLDQLAAEAGDQRLHSALAAVGHRHPVHLRLRRDRQDPGLHGCCRIPGGDAPFHGVDCHKNSHMFRPFCRLKGSAGPAHVY